MSKICDVKKGGTFYRGQNYNQILSMLSSGILPFDSFVTQSGHDHWVELLKFNDFGQFLAGKLLLAANGYSFDSLFNHWYIKDGERSFGPFSLIQMLEFYNQKRIQLDNLVRHPSSTVWETFGTCGPFEMKSLEQLMACAPINHIISRRKHPRIRYDNEVFLSSDAALYRGVTWSLSARGLGIVTDQATSIHMGQNLNIIINANNDHGAVQVKGKVVNLRKETNYERVAIEFDLENESLNQYIDQRVPRL